MKSLCLCVSEAWVWIVMTQLDPDTSQNVYVLDASGRQPPALVAISQDGGIAGWWSADDRQIVYWDDDLRGGGRGFGRKFGTLLS